MGSDRAAVDQWGLRDRAGQFRVVGRDAEEVAAREREAPDRDPVRVDVRQTGCVLDRGVPVGDLLVETDDLARRSPLSPNRRWSKARTAKPASLNRAANWSEAGSFVTEVPPAMITQPPLDPG